MNNDWKEKLDEEVGNTPLIDGTDQDNLPIKEWYFYPKFVSFIEKTLQTDREELRKAINKCTDYDGMVINGRSVPVIKRDELLTILEAKEK